MKKQLDEIELIVGDDELDGIMAMGFVTHPAIEEDFIYFNNNKSNFCLSKTIDKEQGIVVSPALIPDKKIYRYDPETNEEYYVFFSKETIRKLSENFLISGLQNNTNEQHDRPIEEIYLIYSWIVENQHDPLITKYGFKNIPEGTWAVSYKIMNEEVKEKIRSGELRGLSIEAWLSEKFDKHNYYQDTINRLREELKRLEE